MALVHILRWPSTIRRRFVVALEGQVEGKKNRGRFVVQALREQLNRVLGSGIGYINSDISA